jgi:hypothetical protein
VPAAVDLADALALVPELILRCVDVIGNSHLMAAVAWSGHNISIEAGTG